MKNVGANVAAELPNEGAPKRWADGEVTSFQMFGLVVIHFKQRRISAS